MGIIKERFYAKHTKVILGDANIDHKLEFSLGLNGIGSTHGACSASMIDLEVSRKDMLGLARDNASLVQEEDQVGGGDSDCEVRD